MKIINIQPPAGGVEHTTWEAERGNHKFKACLEYTRAQDQLGQHNEALFKNKNQKKKKKTHRTRHVNYYMYLVVRDSRFRLQYSKILSQNVSI